MKKGVLSLLGLLMTSAAATDEVVADDKKTAAPHVLADKEHLGIHFNKHVHDLMTVIEASDQLSLVYIIDSSIGIDEATG